MANSEKKKVFVINPCSHPSYTITCDNMVKNGDFYEFTDETGIIAFVPTRHTIALVSSVDA